MARVQRTEVAKEQWENFKPTELKIFGAYMYAYQDRLPHLRDAFDEKTKTTTRDIVQPLPRYYRHPTSNEQRPWTVYDRFRMAVQTFDVEMKRRPGKPLQFSIADVQPDGNVTSDNVVLEDKVIQESKQAWDAIFSPGGLTWGNEKLLSKWADEYEKILNAYGFKKVKKLPEGGYDVPPFGISGGEMSNILSMEDAVAEPLTTMIPEEPVAEKAPEVVEKRGPGRPKRDAVAV